MTKNAPAQLRLVPAGALLIAAVLAGCGQQQSASSTATGSSAPDTSVSAKANPGSPAGTEHGEDAPVASISARDPGALWSEVRSEETELGKIIQGAQLGKVHHLAFAIRDRVIALAREHGPMARDPKALAHDVGLIRSMAGNLDEFGDKGDLDKTQSEFARLQATLRAIENAFPAGMLGKP